MFVGRTGVERVVRRTCEIMRKNNINDPADTATVRNLGVIDLPTMQKKINFHYSVTLDLFGAEISTNASNAYNASLKGRFRETTIDDDHLLHDSTYPVLKHVNGQLVSVDEPAINAVNSRLCDDFITDCEQVLATWNKAIADHGYDYRLSLPSRAFHRAVGEFSDIYATPDGNVVGQAEWERRRESGCRTTMTWSSCSRSWNRSPNRANSRTGLRRPGPASTASPAILNTSGLLLDCQTTSLTSPLDMDRRFTLLFGNLLTQILPCFSETNS